jgi:hypothetical protein
MGCPGGSSSSGSSSGSGSGSSSGSVDAATDAPLDAGLCDPVAQTGCAASQKCTWIVDQSSPPAGHVGCAPAGSVAQGATCTRGAAGATTGYEDCQKGLACDMSGSACEPICDPSAASGGAGACTGMSACTIYSGFFAETTGDAGTTAVAGICQPTCDPLAQTCGTGKGCYGLPSTTTAPSTFQCSADPNPTLTSDAACTTANGCEDGSSGTPYINGCAAGYIPLFHASWNSTQVICVAYCEPGNTSQSAPANASGLVGSGHTCPDEGAAAPQHECRYWWLFEGTSTPLSAESNGLGVCIAFGNYKYDSNGNGTIDMNDANWPSCTTLSSTGHTFDPVITDTQYWGCESVTTRP